MFKKLTFVTMAFLLSVAANAQQRNIARGAVEGELYWNMDWLQFHSPAGIDSIYDALFHFTENGKKAKINHYVKHQEPDALTGVDLPMQLDYYVMADAMPGVVYITDWYMAYVDGQPYSFNRLWFSDDYGKTWELRDDPKKQDSYYISNFEGVIYKGSGGIHQSKDYGNTWQKIKNHGYGMNGECGLDSCEVFGIAGSYPDPWILYHTYDWYDTYTGIPIEEPYVYVQIWDVLRGGLPGEVYIISRFPDNISKISFSADTGYNFRVVRQWKEGYMGFMTDRKAGDFYIVNSKTWKKPESRQSWIGWFRICVEHYSDYGETLVGTYCHDFSIDYIEHNCAGVMDMEAEIIDKNNVSLRWNAPETDPPPIAYRVYQSDLLLKELPQMTYMDEDLPDGDYVYFIRAVYADGCESLSYNIAKININTTGITEKEKDDGIVVYPNPTKDELTVETDNYPSVQGIEIFDLLGKRHEGTKARKHEGAKEVVMDISHLPTGMYFIRITTENGVVTKKIIKK